MGCGDPSTCQFDADCPNNTLVCKDGTCTPRTGPIDDAGSGTDRSPANDEQATPEVECQDGHSRKCYTGPEGTAGKGLCVEGTQQCTNNKWSECQGEVTPAAEACNAKDDNCDGQVDEGCDCNPGQTRSCYTGPTGTAGKGNCKEGSQTCDSNGKWEACQGSLDPGTETCNGQDDDCNGQVDDNLTNIPDCEKNAGVCQGAKKVCDGAKGWLACTVAEYTKHNSTYEITETLCDNKDNDCDGQVDENLNKACYTATQGCVPDGQGYKCEGICKAGTQTCQAGQWGVCQGQLTPQAETCNSQDDNCDGKVDEVCVCKPGEKAPCYNGDPKTQNTGICKDGQKTCQPNGQWGPCSGEIRPRQELCNGQDDDCNGQTDENLTGPPCAKSFGVCVGLRQTCAGAQGWKACNATDYKNHSADYQANETLCDGKDNDCDGNIDENLSQACYTGPNNTQGTGPCKGGMQLCVSGSWSTCNGEVKPSTETCNGIDDDCNGKTDDNVSGLGQACTLSNLQGECAKGKRACSNKQVICEQVNQPVKENCTNGKDDDCNGKVDDCGVCTVGQTRPCFTGITGCTKSGSTYQCQGACKAGVQQCVNQQWATTCTGEVLATAEACNWKDDDCNGKIDDQGACVFSGWGPSPFPVGATNAAFFDPSTGVAIGTNGRLWRTTNGGQTWASVPSGTTEILHSITSLPQGLVLVVGANGTVLRSTDQGETFTKIGTGTTLALYGVAASAGFSTHYAVAVGQSGTVLTSTDGGASWTSRSSGTSETLYGAAMSSSSSSTMIAVGSKGTIVRSSGGTTWSTVTSGTTKDLQSVSFRSGTGIAVGAGVTLRSTNNGSSWSLVSVPNNPSLTHVVASGEATFVAAGSGNKYYLSLDNGATFLEKTYGVSGSFSGITMRSPTALLALSSGRAALGEGPAKFQDSRRSFTFYEASYSNHDTSGNTLALAVGSNGTMYRSENSGAQWKPVYIPTGSAFYGVSHYGNNAIAVGSTGMIYTSSDQGKTWMMRTSGTTDTLESVVIHGTNAIAVGYQGRLLYSTNSGTTWTSVTAPDKPSTYSTLYRVSMKGTTAIAVGSSGWIIRSTDSGKTWTRVGKNVTTSTLRGVYYYPLNDTVVAVGLSGTILYSADSGATWTKATSGTTSSLYGVGADYGDVFVTGSSGTSLKSSDRGKTWTAQPSFFSFTMYSIMRNYLTALYVAAGSSGSLFLSTDYANTWSYTMLPSTSLYAALGVGGSQFLASGTSSLMYRTTDFGQNWTIMRGPSSATYYGLSRDPNTGNLLLCGSSGTLMRSADNGQSWSVVTSGVSNTLYATAAATSGVFLAVGSSSTILRSSNSGSSFSKITAPTTSRTLYGAACAGATCVAVGSSSTIFRSTNGGSSWSTITSPASSTLYSAAFSNTQRGVIVGSSGVALYTTNGGASWTQGTTPSSDTIYGVQAIDTNRYIAIDAAGRFLATADGGQTWSVHSPGLDSALRSISLQGSLGLGVGFNGTRVLYTRP